MIIIIKTLKLILLIAVCGLLNLPVDAETASGTSDKLTFYTEINHPHTFYKDGTEQLTGIAYDIVYAMIEKTGLDVIIEVNPWLRSVKKQKENDNSCIFAMNRTEEREKQYQWIGPLVSGGLAIYKKSDSDIEINSLYDLKGHTVVGKIDSIALDAIKPEHGAKIVVSGTDEAAAKMFHIGRADLWAGGMVDTPLAASYIGIPAPAIALQLSKADVNLGCSLKLDSKVFELLRQAHSEVQANLAPAILKKYLSPKP